MLHCFKSIRERVSHAYACEKPEKPIDSKVTENILEVMSDLHRVTMDLTIAGDTKSVIDKMGAKIFNILYS